jgi:hypothetical protein
MSRSIATALMFQEGNAEEEMNLYVSLFKGSEVVRVERYGPEGPGTEGSIKRAARQKGAGSDSRRSRAGRFLVRSEAHLDNLAVFVLGHEVLAKKVGNFPTVEAVVTVVVHRVFLHA